MTMENNLKFRNHILNEVICILEQYLDELEPCDHSVNICSCPVRQTLDAFSTYCWQVTGGEVGYEKFRFDTTEEDIKEQIEAEDLCAKTDKELDIVAFALDMLNQTNAFRLSQLKAEADARNAAFRKGTIND